MTVSLLPLPVLALDSEPEGLTTWSWHVPSGDVTWSAGIDGLFGLPPGGFGGTYAAYLQLVHPEDRAHFQALIQRTLEGEDEYVMSHRVLWPDGSVHWIDGRGRLTRDAGGQPLRLDGVTWNAGARKLMESRSLHLHRVQAVAGAVRKELLRVSSDHEAFAHACRIVVEHGHFRFAWVGILRDDGARLALVSNFGVEDGYLVESGLTGDLSTNGGGPVERTLREERPILVNDIERDPTFARWRDAALRRGYRGCAALPLRRGGSVVGVLCLYAAETGRFDEPQLQLLQELASDIAFTLDVIDEAAQRRLAEQAMTRSEQRFRALFENASEAIVIADEDDRIQKANAVACEMTGFTLDELRALRVDDLLVPLAGGERLRTHGGVEERRVRRKDGTRIDAEVSATLLDDGRLHAHFRDVTLRKRMQEQLILTDRLASLGRLAAGVAHEVNNPLAYSMLSLQRIDRALDGAGDSPLVSEIRAATAHALDGAERVRAVVRALGSFGREDHDAPSAVDVHRVLDAAVRLADNRVRGKGRVVKDYGAKQGVRAHELRLGQVFVNLLINAADALRTETADTNRIEVRTFDQGPEVVVEIEDCGTGIAPEIIGRIFDPFFTTKDVGEGTGLGLSISHSILDSFGATILVDSTPGVGSVFRVKLLAEEVLAGSANATRPAGAG